MAGGRPQISAILFTPNSFAVVSRVVRHLHAQSARDQIEVVIACPAASRLNPDLQMLEDFGAFVIVEVGETTQFAARAAAIRAATAPIIALQEDHAYPDAGYVEALLQAFAEGYHAVGPTLFNGNPNSALSRVMFVMNHKYALPKPRGRQVVMLAHNNAAYLRSVLLPHYDDKLDEWPIHVEAVQRDLVRRGYRLHQAAAARVYHVNVSHPWHTAVMRFREGRIYGARRSRDWPISRRLVYFLGGPLIPIARLRNDIATIRRFRPHGLALFPFMAAALFVEIASGCGEMAGYLMGEGDSFLRRYDFEVDRRMFLNASDRKALSRDGLRLPIDAEPVA